MHDAVMRTCLQLHIGWSPNVSRAGQHRFGFPGPCKLQLCQHPIEVIPYLISWQPQPSRMRSAFRDSQPDHTHSLITAQLHTLHSHLDSDTLFRRNLMQSY